jgi:hypothetical protein
VKEPPECGDASACLMLRTPVIRRDRCRRLQKVCPLKPRLLGGISQKQRQAASLGEVRTQA